MSNYQLSDDGNWCLLTCQSDSPSGLYYTGILQLYSMRNRASQLIKGCIGEFTTIYQSKATPSKVKLCDNIPNSLTITNSLVAVFGYSTIALARVAPVVSHCRCCASSRRRSTTLTTNSALLNSLAVARAMKEVVTIPPWSPRCRSLQISRTTRSLA